MATKERSIPRFSEILSTKCDDKVETEDVSSQIQVQIPESALSTEDFSIIRFLRVCMGMNQKEFSQLCDISPIYCHELESGKRKKPSDNVVNSIAQNCGIKASTIRFFLNEQSGKSESYKKRLISALESIADGLDDFEDIELK